MLKNQKMANQIVVMINTLIDASTELYKAAADKDYILCNAICTDMMGVLESIRGQAQQITQEIKEVNIDIALESVIYSLKRINTYFNTRSINIFNKIEFELIPLLQDMLMRFYFWCCVYPDVDKMQKYYTEEVVELAMNSYIDSMDESDDYKYELSVIVVAYNKLEYTKLCVENILNYIPKNINYELILVNHGSSDGTKEYFESLAPTKQLDIYKNGGGLLAYLKIVEGKYTLAVSNDVLVTENAIENMMKCIKSDDKIAMIVPSTPNVSNLQSIPAKYDSLETMFEFAKANNVYNTNRHEQRVRLCNPIALVRSSYIFSSKGICNHGFLFTKNENSFPDDLCAMLIRRKGWKMILQKDAYCYHFGSITISSDINKFQEQTKQDFYLEGRKAFYYAFGIDPWGVGFCYSQSLLNLLDCNNTGKVNILGINCGLGSNPLKIKEFIKENNGNKNVKIFNITDDTILVNDLKSVSDAVLLESDYNRIFVAFPNHKFDYVIIENPIENKIFIKDFIRNISKRLVQNGRIAINIKNSNISSEIMQIYKNAKICDDWIVI